MSFNTTSFLINNKSNNTIITDNLRSSQYSMISKSGINIDTSLIINSNIYNIAYIDTIFYNSEFEENLIIKLNQSGIFIDKILYYKYDSDSNISFENFINNLYINNNIRLFLSSANSNQCFSIFNYLNSHNDIIFISTSSTVNFIEKPNNLLRLSLQDNILFKILFSDILPNFYKLSKINNNSLDTNKIQKIYLIYSDDLYSNNIKSLLEDFQTKFNNFNYYFLEYNDNTKNEIKDTIINSNSITDLFIIATLSSQSILNLFSNNNMSDKFIFFTDPFYDSNLFTKIKLDKAFIIVASDNEKGHILTTNLLKTKKLQASGSNKQLNTLLSFLFMSSHIFYKNLNNNDQLLSLLYNNGLFKSGQFFSNYINIFRIDQISYKDSNNEFYYFFMFNYFLNFKNFYIPSVGACSINNTISSILNTSSQEEIQNYKDNKILPYINIINNLIPIF